MGQKIDPAIDGLNHHWSAEAQPLQSIRFDVRNFTPAKCGYDFLKFSPALFED